MDFKEKLKSDFYHLISQTKEQDFNSAKLNFYRTLFAHTKEEDNLDTCVGLFEVTCKHYISMNFDSTFKNLLLGDFEKIVIAVNEFQTA